MDVEGAAAIVSGGASGLGEATVRALHAGGAVVTIADVQQEKGEGLAADLGERAVFAQTDVTDEAAVEAAVSKAAGAAEGGLRIAVSCAGIGWPEKLASAKKGPHNLMPFETVLRINVIGTFNVMRYAAAAMIPNEPNADGERGVLIQTASVAAFDGQVGQIAYAASKGAIASMTLPAARDLAGNGIRACTIAPGLFDTPLLALLPQEQRQALGAQVPFPSRLGRPEEFARLAVAIAENPMLNGETIRLDGAIRMQPR